MEQRLIDANALLERLERKKCEPAKVRYTEGYNDALMRFRSMVHGAPTVDAVPVTRCAQCKWCDYPATNSTKYGCRLFDRCVKGDWFCADGERRTE